MIPTPCLLHSCTARSLPARLIWSEDPRLTCHLTGPLNWLAVSIITAAKTTPSRIGTMQTSLAAPASRS